MSCTAPHRLFQPRTRNQDSLSPARLNHILESIKVISRHIHSGDNAYNSRALVTTACLFCSTLLKYSTNETCHHDLLPRRNHIRHNHLLQTPRPPLPPGRRHQIPTTRRLAMARQHHLLTPEKRRSSRSHETHALPSSTWTLHCAQHLRKNRSRGL